jgi:hypothetical protein
MYICILLPFFAKIFLNLQEAFMQEVRLSKGVKNQFMKMFDSLNEGIIVLNDGDIEFMNDLSNKFMTFVCGTHDEYTNNIEDK